MGKILPGTQAQVLYLYTVYCAAFKFNNILLSLLTAVPPNTFIAQLGSPTPPSQTIFHPFLPPTSFVALPENYFYSGSAHTHTHTHTRQHKIQELSLVATEV